jgi:RecA/RadA recombinase
MAKSPSLIIGEQALEIADMPMPYSVDIVVNIDSVAALYATCRDRETGFITPVQARLMSQVLRAHHNVSHSLVIFINQIRV